MIIVNFVVNWSLVTVLNVLIKNFICWLLTLILLNTLYSL